MSTKTLPDAPGQKAGGSGETNRRPAPQQAHPGAAPDSGGAVPIAVWLQNTSFGDVSQLAEHFIDEEFSHLCTFLPPLHVPPLPRYRTGQRRRACTAPDLHSRPSSMPGAGEVVQADMSMNDLRRCWICCAAHGAQPLASLGHCR